MVTSDERRETREIGIREATDADLPSILAIVNKPIAESPFIWAEQPKTLEERRAWFDAHRTMDLPVLVAVSDEQVVGWSSLSSFRGASGYRFTSEVSVYVDDQWHGHGLGTRLVRAVEDEARVRSLHALLAVIDAEHEASIRLFTGLGYSEVGRFPEVGRKFDQWRGEVFLLKLL